MLRAYPNPETPTFRRVYSVKVLRVYLEDSVSELLFKSKYTITCDYNEDTCHHESHDPTSRVWALLSARDFLIIVSKRGHPWS